jgi:enoyl-CoA hydratase
MAERLRRMPQVVIAAINGACAGAGLGIALAADIRIAAESARLLVASVKLGLTACECGISYLLPRLVGASRAFEIMLTGRTVEAAEAERIGLCAGLVNDGAVVDAALATAKTILANSPFSVVHTKRVMWENLDAASYRAAVELENRSQILASLTDDYKEATAAFAQKRIPRFRGQ